jgi:hypothetical protein
MDDEVPKTQNYLSIPADIYQLVVEHKVLSVVEAWLLANIYNRSRGKEPFYGTNAGLGRLCRLSKHRAREIVAKLIRLGLLKNIGYRTMKNGRQRLLRCALHGVSLKDGITPIEDVGGVLENQHTPMLENQHTPMLENQHHIKKALKTKTKKKNIPRFPSNGSEDMSFELNVPSSKDKVNLKEVSSSEFDLQWAARIKKVINENWAIVKWRISKQVKFITILRKRHGEEQVQKVLDWYCSTVKKTTKLKIPDCERLLRPKVWLWLLADYEKWDQREKPIPISEEAISIVKSLGSAAGLNKEDLQRVTQISLDNYKAFRKNLADYALATKDKDTHREKRLHLLADYLSNGGMSSRVGVVTNWLREFIDKVEFVQDKHETTWKGNLMEQVLSLDSQRFQDYGRTLTQRFGMKPKDWDLLLKELKRETS